MAIYIGNQVNAVASEQDSGSSVPLEKGWTVLFDGKSFKGWEGNLDVFRIEDKSVVAGTLNNRIKQNEFLCTKKQFRDFELRLQAKLIGPGRNAGIQFRSKRIPDHHEVIGYQCDMGQMQGHSIWGYLYDESRRRKFLVKAPPEKIDAATREGQWNDLRIRCEGNHIQIWVNGYQTVDYKEKDESIPQTGIIGLQIHGGEPSEAWYRNIRIKTL